MSVSCKLPRSTAMQLSRTVTSIHFYPSPRNVCLAGLKGLHANCCSASQITSRRQFSSSAKTQLRDVFPVAETSQIRKTEAAWPHPGYTEDQMVNNIKVAHREARDWTDKLALSMVKLLRWGTDVATGYSHQMTPPKSKTSDGIASSPPVEYTMNERKWLVRFIFLESVAGVPGMVGGMLRHLHSIRRLKRDNGWIETLLEEAYNERMHLLTFLKIAEPGLFMKLMIIGAQGVFFNSMVLAYLISPRICHRFVGYLEEEACGTYTLAIEDIEAGLLPKWTDMKAPDIAIGYWNMPEGHQTMRDLLLYVRADEAKHREVNHTLANLKQKTDPNPFVSTYKDPKKPHPGSGLATIRSTGWEREEVM